VGYVQDERYIASEHMDKVRPGTGREGSLGCVRRDCFGYPVGNKLPTLQILHVDVVICSATQQIMNACTTLIGSSYSHLNRWKFKKCIFERSQAWHGMVGSVQSS